MDADSVDADEVDRLVRAWQRERPDVDVTPLEVLSRVSRLARYLDLARREAFGGHDLEAWEFDVLAALRRAGSPYTLSPGDIQRQNLVSSGTISNRLDRLESRGWLRREPDETDRRGVRVVLTVAGREVVDAALDDLLAQEREILGSLTLQQREQLAATLRSLVTPFDNAD